MTDIRKEFFKRLGFIGLGIIPILILANNKGPERFIALAGFLFCIYNFIRIISKIQLIVDDFNPPKIKDTTPATSFEKIIYYTSMVLFFGGLVFEIFEISNIDNTIDGLKLFWTFAFIGLLLATVITIILKVFKPSVYYESNRRLSVHLGLFVGFFLICPAFACFINQRLADDKTMIEEYTILEKGSSSTRNQEYYLYLDFNGDKQRVTVWRTFWEKVEDQQKIILLTKKGILGYRYIIEFDTIQKQNNASR
jgi:hypothetical protein